VTNTRPGSEAETGAPLSLESVRDAAKIVSRAANRTPVMVSRQLDSLTGGSVHLKCENFQRTGSFKFRGAFHALSRLDAGERSRGVLTYSSGNHAQAIALVGRLLDIPTTVVMPSDAPEAKRLAAAGYGAEIVRYDPQVESREIVAERIRLARNFTLVPPFDHPHIVAGQGTAALELIEEVQEIDLLLVPCGGGGLLSGSALAATSVLGSRVVGVEPELADDATRSFRTGVLQRVGNPPTIADGLRTPSLGSVTWPIIRSHVSEMRTVSETRIVEAMRFLWSRMKLVVEPSGAVALAALLSDPDLGRRRRVGIILSGGNVDLSSACGLFAAVGV
jgi:threo-3-hydroxy-L-aspartate ammonia-lyase